jgi:hypothetical protein
MTSNHSSPKRPLRRVVRRSVGNGWRPHDVEALEHKFRPFIDLDTQTRACTPHVPQMGIHPPVARTITLPLIPSERLINAAEGPDPQFFAPHHRPRSATGICRDPMTADPRQGLVFGSKLHNRSRRRALRPMEYEPKQLIGHLCGVAEALQRWIGLVRMLGMLSEVFRPHYGRRLRIQGIHGAIIAISHWAEGASRGRATLHHPQSPLIALRWPGSARASTQATSY